MLYKYHSVLLDLDVRSRSHGGYSLIIVMLAITLLTLEVSFLTQTALNSVGMEGLLVSDNLQARQGLETGFTRLLNSLNTYLRSNDRSRVDTDFAQGGSSAINNVTLTTTNPETAATDNTSTVISAWVQARRGDDYQLRVTATVGQVSLTASRWITVTACGSAGTTKSLATISTGLNFGTWQYYYIKDSTVPTGGRTQSGLVYFADNAAMYLWSPTSGLSTLVTGTNLADWNLATNPDTSRVFFGQYQASGAFYTWAPTTGLSTIVSGRPSPGVLTTFVAPATDGVFFGEYNNPGNFYYWAPATGLSTIITGRPYPGAETSSEWATTMAVNPLTGRVVFGEDPGGGWPTGNPANFYTWHPNTGLSTLLSGVSRPGVGNVKIVPRMDYYYFGDSAQFYFWSPSNGLSTIVSGKTIPATYSAVVDPNSGRVFFGGGYGENFFYAWHPSTGLSTLATMTDDPGYYASHVDPVNSRAFWSGCCWNAGSDINTLLTWSPATGLSTIVTGRYDPGFQYFTTDSQRQRYFLGDRGPLNNTQANFYTWAPSTGLSTILSGRPNPRSIQDVDQKTGRVYIFEDNNPGNVYTWAASTGLSTIMTGLNRPVGMLDPASGRYFFGATGANPSTLYMYTPPEGCNP